jgi:hypothetical protein
VTRDQETFCLLILFCLKLSCCGFVCTILLLLLVLSCCHLPLFFCLVLEQKVLIMPSTANKKRAPLSQPQTSNSKRAATAATAKGCGKARGTSKNLGTTALSTLGFLSSKRPPIHIGQKYCSTKASTGKQESLLKSKIICLSTRCCR